MNGIDRRAQQLERALALIVDEWDLLGKHTYPEAEEDLAAAIRSASSLLDHIGDEPEQCGAWMSCHADPPMLGVHVEVNTDPPKPPYGTPEREAFDRG
jgi:hypothetical protein